jgi:DNA-binding GntR family transcriptional regulator
MHTVQSRADTVKDWIRDDIVAGGLAFGARLRIDELASRYSSSHMPVREALRSLAGEGLVVSETNKGARVITVDQRQVENLFTVRIALEVALARQAAQAMTRGRLIEVTALEDERLASVGRGDYAQGVAINQRFHRRIYEAAENGEGLAVLDRHWVLLAALWSRLGYRPERLGGVASDHDHILRALRDGDAEACGTMTAAHVTKTRQDILDLMAQPTKVIS